MTRWWIRRRLRKCGCDLCMRHLGMLEEMWAAEKLYAHALKGEPEMETESGAQVTEPTPKPTDALERGRLRPIPGWEHYPSRGGKTTGGAKGMELREILTKLDLQVRCTCDYQPSCFAHDYTRAIEALFAAERERYAKLEAAAEQIIKELRAQVRLGIDPAQVSSIADGLERALREPK